ncbi:hypothetical protein M0812_20156 [Anaeramoeba flamelloides]|uniref:FYVE-type domain-containing protein n=1 Tax=Anaeramoeba flamelloides TaxID=1746091 RepID=A0AAV7YZ99_9EUKA|nr:hypothetical protein M0812_20156 [Anaeramoeba flamelloides]
MDQLPLFYDFPTESKINQESFSRTFQVVSITPPSLNALEFQILIDQRWYTSEFDDNEDSNFPSWLKVLQFSRDQTLNSAKICSVITFSQQPITLYHFVQYFCKKSNFHLCSIRKWSVPHSNYLLDFCAFQVNIYNQRIVLRGMVYMLNDAIICTYGTCPSNIYNQLKYHFLISCSSLKLNELFFFKSINTMKYKQYYDNYLYFKYPKYLKIFPRNKVHLILKIDKQGKSKIILKYSNNYNNIQNGKTNIKKKKKLTKNFFNKNVTINLIFDNDNDNLIQKNTNKYVNLKLKFFKNDNIPKSYDLIQKNGKNNKHKNKNENENENENEEKKKEKNKNKKNNDDDDSNRNANKTGNDNKLKIQNNNKEIYSNLFIDIIPKVELTNVRVLNSILEHFKKQIYLSEVDIVNPYFFIPGNQFLSKFNKNHFFDNISDSSWILGREHLFPFIKSIKEMIGVVMIYGKISNLIPVEIFIGIKQLKNSICLIYSITTSKELNLKNWVSNQNTFELVCRTICLSINQAKKDKNTQTENNQIEVTNLISNLNSKFTNLEDQGWKMIYEMPISLLNNPLFHQFDLLEKPQISQPTHCFSCDEEFNMRKWRKFCKHCGLGFCKNCLKKQTPIPKFGYNSPVSVCENCKAFLNKNNFLGYKRNNQKNIYNLHLWKSWNEGSTIETKTSYNDQNIKEFSLSYCLIKKTNTTYTLQLMDIDDQQNNQTISFSDLKDDNYIEHNGIIKENIGCDLITINGKMFNCNIYKSHSKTNKSIMIYEWIPVVSFLDFPIRIFQINKKTFRYKDRRIIKLQDIQIINNISFHCLVFQEIEVQINGKKKQNLLWISRNIPGGLIKLISKDENGLIETTQVIKIKNANKKIY